MDDDGWFESKVYAQGLQESQIHSFPDVYKNMLVLVYYVLSIRILYNPYTNAADTAAMTR